MRCGHQPLVVGACAAALAAGLVFTFSGCKPPCQGAACAKDAGAVVGCVPDSAFDQGSAVTLTPGTPVTGLVCPVLDKDFYQFTTGASDTLAEVSLTTTATFSQVNLSGSVINAAGESLGHMQDPNGTDGPTDIRMVVKLAPATVYFVVVGDLNNANSDGAAEYSLNVKTFPDPDTHEPNNSAATASAADTTATGNSAWLSATGDVDAYSFDAPAGSILRFELSIPEEHDAMGMVVAPRVSPQAVISDSTGNSIYASPAVPVTGVNGVRRIHTNVAIKGTGPFTCIVSDNIGGADYRTVEGNYTLRLEVIPDPDVDERPLPGRNDTLATAIKVAPGGDVHPAVSTVGDVDNYMVTVGAADGSSGRKILVVDITLPPGTPEANFQPVVSLWDQVLSTGNQSGNCLNLAGPGAHRYLCRKPCGAGSVCQGSPGGDQQECMAADPAMPTVDRYCAEPHIFRALKVHPDGSVNQTVRYSLRSGRSPVVQVGDQLSDSFDERPFTIHISVMDDPDTHEPDDLPPPLLAVGGSGTDVRKRDLATFVHPSMNSNAGFPPLCQVTPDPDGGIPDGGGACLGRSAIADGGPSDPTMLPINCGNYDETTMTVTGFLAYEGDHDYYRFDVPEGFYSLDLEYSYDPPGGGTTPVELAAFIYTADSNGDMPGFIPLRGSFVNTRQVQSVGANVNCQFDTNCPGQQRCAVRPGMGDCKLNTGEIVSTGCSSDGDCAQGVCRPNGPTSGVCFGDCVSSTECTNPDAGVTSAVCIKNPGGTGICFQDEDNNPGTGARVFGPSGPGGECLFANQCNIRPFYVEVVDNGLNDSDPLTPYTLRVHVRCGCPVAACGSGNTCTYIDCSVGN